jgi:hypothetical protein
MLDLESTSITEEDETAPSLTSLNVLSIKTLLLRSLLELTAATLNEEGTESNDRLCLPEKGLCELEMPALLCRNKSSN